MSTNEDSKISELTKSLNENKKNLDNKLNNKRKRIPIDEQRRNLTFEKKDPNYYYRVVNFKNDGTGNERIHRFLTAGYEIVKDESGLGDYLGLSSEKKSNTVVSTGVGGGTIGYLMRLPIEDRLEDLKYKKKLADEPLKALEDRGKKADKKNGLNVALGFNAKYNRSTKEVLDELNEE